MQMQQSIVPASQWAPLEVYRASSLLAAIAGPGAPATPYAAEIAVCLDWNRWITMGAGLLRTIQAALQLALGHSTSPAAQTALKAVSAALHAFYDALNGMNNPIIQAITDMQAGKPPTITFDPMTIPDWPVPAAGAPVKSDLITAAWTTIEPLLQQLDSTLAAKYPNHPIVIALGGVLNAGDDIVKALKTYYPDLGGN